MYLVHYYGIFTLLIGVVSQEYFNVQSQAVSSALLKQNRFGISKQTLTLRFCIQTSILYYVLSNFSLTIVKFFTDIETDFIENLKVLIPLLLAPENLIVKEIGGQRVKAKELVQYFKSYMKIYNSNELPEPKTMLVVSNPFNYRQLGGTTQNASQANNILALV